MDFFCVVIVLPQRLRFKWNESYWKEADVLLKVHNWSLRAEIYDEPGITNYTENK